MSDVNDSAKNFIDIFDEEIDVICKLHGLDPNGKEDKKKELVGLAFSGGGIRSATFGLGVLETLKEKGILEKIDYLSTVSGGGYIGGWLSANCRRHGKEWLKMPVEHDANKEKIEVTKNDWKEWEESVKHLRRYSNYLSPDLSLLSADTWSMVTIWLRNTLLLQLMIILGIAGLLLLPRLVSPLINFGANELLQIATLLLFTYVVVWIAGNLKEIKGNEEKTSTCKSAASSEPPTEIEEDSILSFLVKLIPCNKSSQGTVQWHVIFLMLISLGFSALLWTHAEENREFWNCITYVFSNENSLWWFLLLPYAALTLLSACSSRNYINSFLVAIPASVVLYLLLATALYFLGAWKVLLTDKISFADEGGSLLAFAWAPPMVLGALSLTINVLIGMQGNGSFEYVREWWSRFGAWLAICGLVWMLGVIIAFYGPLWSAMLYYDGSWKPLGSSWIGTVIAGLFAGKSASTNGIESPNIATKAKDMLAKAAPIVFIAGLVIVISMILHLTIANLSDDNFKVTKANLLGEPVTEEAKQIVLLRRDGKLDSKETSTPEQADKAITESQKKWNSQNEAIYLQKDVQFDHKSQQVITEKPDLTYPTHWKLLAKADWIMVFFACLFCMVCSAWLLSWRIDINEFSLNAFYRNRLARCYLGATRMLGAKRKSKESDKSEQDIRAPHEFTGFDNNDDLKLSELLVGADNKDKPYGPFHIVNCTLNLGGSKDLSMHTRHSAVFTLTPLHCGSSYVPRKSSGDPLEEVNGKPKEIGYRKIKNFCGEHHQPTLGQAISVSGAAASPNMGYHTSAPVAFLMTLFNARLGWWFPNPSGSKWKEPSPPNSLKYLVEELFGTAKETDDFLAISDGGHFENLAAYELVKRRCQVIIISDAECDPKLQFEGLANLIRLSEVDLDAEIDIKVEKLHPLKTITKKVASNSDDNSTKRIESDFEWGEERYAVGTITYRKTEKFPYGPGIGYLVYIKASMNGHEDTAVMQYKATHPDFPHETTGDQFYAEDQFESYRALGKSITKEAFDKIAGLKNEDEDKLELPTLRKILDL